MLFKDKFRLHTPGPTPIPPSVQHAMNRPMIGHRSSTCSAIIEESSKRLQPIFGTKQDVLIITGSGTSALESAVSNTVKAGDEVSVVVTGAFGDRFAKLTERFGCHVHRLDIPWGERCTPEELKSHLRQHPDVKAIFMTYCETSTGVLNPIQDLARVAKEETDALTIVDGVSCIGAVPMEMDAWGIDIAVTGSQKALMLPTGLAFVAVSERAWQVIENNSTPRFYLDLSAYRKSLGKQTTPYTPAVSLLFGLEEVLNLIEAQGMGNVIARHRLMMEMTRAGIRALGLPLMTTDEAASPTVTSVYGTKDVDVENLRRTLSAMNVTVAGGQQHLKGQIFRIGHMGYCEPGDILAVIATLEVALKTLNVPVSLGRGVQAAEEVWARV